MPVAPWSGRPDARSSSRMTGQPFPACAEALCHSGPSRGRLPRGIRIQDNEGRLSKQPVPFLRLLEGAGRERVLPVAEMARLWDADMPDRIRVFLALAIGTAGGSGLDG
jgi:hypothetical protein